MTLSHLVRKATALTLVLAAFGASATAHAEEEFDVAVADGKVVVKTHGKWHINKEYPWKLTIDGKKLDKSHFELTEHEATIAAPKGEGKLKGGVCNGDQCQMFEKAVVIR
jgi:hypothetical protein